jgi:hypothetical protein
MLTAVLLLMLPAVLGMSVMRVVQLPRDLWAGRARINPRRRLLCAFAFGVLYCALALYTTLVLRAAARALWTPPRTIQDLFAVTLVDRGTRRLFLRPCRAAHAHVARQDVGVERQHQRLPAGLARPSWRALGTSRQAAVVGASAAAPLCVRPMHAQPTPRCCTA